MCTIEQNQMNLIREHAPCFVYSKEEITSACGQLQEALPEFEFLYSIKANAFDPVVKLIADCGFGADAASFAEVSKALSCGITPDDIYYSTPGKTENDIRNAFGKCVLIADSLHELEMIEQIAAQQYGKQKLGIRVHPAFAIEGKTGASKFGIDLEQIAELKEIISRCSHIEICGVHVHLQSQVLDVNKLIRYYQNVLDLAIHLQEEIGIRLGFINFGSGIGTVYDEAKDIPVDLLALHEGCAMLIEKNRNIGAHLLIETGRFITCRAGKYYTPVLDKKISHGKTYLIVPNGMNGFMRPTVAAMLEKVSGGRDLPGMEPLFTEKNEFQVRVIGSNGSLKNSADEVETVDIVGNLCTSMDIIAEGITLPESEIGDLIEISNAGSYGKTLSPVLFASQNLPEELLL